MEYRIEHDSMGKYKCLPTAIGAPRHRGALKISR